MSDSVRPLRRQPTRLLRPWDSPGKNTGVGCHFLLQCMKVKSQSEVAQLCPTLSDPMDCSLPGLLRPGDFPGKSTGVGCHCLLWDEPYWFSNTEPAQHLMVNHTSLWCAILFRLAWLSFINILVRISVSVFLRCTVCNSLSFS